MKVATKTVKTAHEVIALVKSQVRQQIERCVAGRCRLHVPVPPEHKLDANAHFHLFPELFIQLAGTQMFTLPHRELGVPSGSMCVMPAQVTHEGRPANASKAFRYLVVTAHQGLVTLIDVGQGRPNSTAVFHSQLSSKIQQHFNDLAECSGPGGNPLAGRGLLLAALARLLEALENPASDVREHYKIAQCRLLVRDHISDEALTVRRLAQWMHCSSDYLSHLFCAQTGTRLAAYINQQRVARACHLLDDTSLNVAETAIACGYTDPGYFIRIFRRTAGMTPRQYRFRHRFTNVPGSAVEAPAQ